MARVDLQSDVPSARRDPVPLQGRNHSRLQGFSDGVFALAATLLVVTLEVPDSYEALLDTLAGFPAFALAFAAIVSLWNNHRQFFSTYPLGDSGTIAINSILLFVLLLYVYPLKLFAEVVAGRFLGVHPEVVPAMEEPEIAGLYVIFGLGVLATMLAFLALHLRAYRRRRELGLDANALHVLWHDVATYSALSVIAAGSTAVAALGVGIGIGLPALLYLLAPAVSIGLEMRRRQAFRRTGVSLGDRAR